MTKNGIDVSRKYPTIFEYLKSFGEEFRKRGAQGQHWTNLRACSFFDDFKKEKIVWIELTDLGRFALCKDEVYLLNSAYFLLPPPSLSIKYLLAILNSKVIQFYLSLIAETSGMGTTRWINQYVKKFPIPDPIPEIEQQITLLVDRILSITDDAASYLDSPQKQSSVKKVEEQLDELVYKLFGLDDKEISLIEAHIEKE